MDDEYEIYTSNLKDDPIAEFILSNLNAYNYSQVQRDFKPYVIALKRKENIFGGAECVSAWNWMHVKLIGIKEPQRRRGHGTLLMNRIEKEAIARKCVGIHLDTFSFQAKDFYLKLGFEIFGTIEDHPKGHKRFYLKKFLIY